MDDRSQNSTIYQYAILDYRGTNTTAHAGRLSIMPIYPNFTGIFSDYQTETENLFCNCIFSVDIIEGILAYYIISPGNLALF